MINKVILIGNLGRDPEVHTASSGNIVTQLSLATTRRVKQADGSYGDETEWHRVICFSKLAEVARDYLAKGRQVYVEGRLRTRKYADKQGVERWVTEVICEQMKMIGRKDDGAQAPAPAPAPARSTPASTPSYTDDDVPF
jgi:single-strand DNA-binding protein